LHKPGSDFSSSDGKYAFPTLVDMAEKGRDVLFLQVPCPGSPYGYLFLEKPHKATSVYDPGSDEE